MVIIKRRIVISLFTLCLFCLFCVTAFAANPVTPENYFDYKGTDVVASANTPYRTDNAFFKDEAQVLTRTQQGNFWEELQNAADQMDISIAVFLGGNYRTDSETKNFTYDCAAAVFGVNSDSLFIYLDFEGHSPSFDYIRALNNAETIFNQSTRDDILQSMYDYLPSSNEPIYSDDVNEALIQGIEEILSTYRNNNYLLTTSYSNISRSSRSDTKSDKISPEVWNTLKKIPKVVYFAIGGLILLLVVIWIITQFIKTLSSINTSHYDDDDYHSHSSSRYRRHYRNRPSRSSRPHHSSSHSSSHSSKPSSSGTGRHR